MYKHDHGKSRWDLVPARAVGSMVDVITFGAAKYSDDGWRNVPSPRRRYYAAAMRHLWAWSLGEKRDSESGLPHLAHAMASLSFILDLELADEDESNPK